MQRFLSREWRWLPVCHGPRFFLQTNTLILPRCIRARTKWADSPNCWLQDQSIAVRPYQWWLGMSHACHVPSGNFLSLSRGNLTSLALSPFAFLKLPTCALHFIFLLLSCKLLSDCLIRILLWPESTNPRLTAFSHNFAQSSMRISALFVMISWLPSPSLLLWWRHSESSWAFNLYAHCARTSNVIMLSSLLSLELHLPARNSSGKLSSLAQSSCVLRSQGLRHSKLSSELSSPDSHLRGLRKIALASFSLQTASCSSSDPWSFNAQLLLVETILQQESPLLMSSCDVRPSYLFFQPYLDLLASVSCLLDLKSSRSCPPWSLKFLLSLFPCPCFPSLWGFLSSFNPPEAFSSLAIFSFPFSLWEPFASCFCRLFAFKVF